jgi:hypothetical protein
MRAAPLARRSSSVDPVVTVVTVFTVVTQMRKAVLLTVLVLAACARPAASDAGTSEPPASPGGGAPSTGARQVKLEFQQGQGGSASGGEQGATATAGSGQIAIRGTMQTPNPCYKLSGELQQQGQTLSVRVVGQADPDAMCIQSIGSVPYTATLRDVAPGTYTVRVMHTYPGTGWDAAAALETQVTVR